MKNYSDIIQTHYCNLHKETFIFLRMFYESRKRRQLRVSFIKIIKFLNRKKQFSIGELMIQFKLSYNTVLKYVALLKLLKVCRPLANKEYIFKSNIILREALFLMQHNYVCPLILIKSNVSDEEFDLSLHNVASVTQQKLI